MIVAEASGGARKGMAGESGVKKRVSAMIRWSDVLCTSYTILVKRSALPDHRFPIDGAAEWAALGLVPMPWIPDNWHG